MENRRRMAGDSGANPHGLLHAIKGHLAADILRVGEMQRKSARDRYHQGLKSQRKDQVGS